MIPGFCRTRETFRHQPASDYPGARNGTPGFIHLPGWIPRESVTPQTGSRSPPRGLPLALGAFLWPWMVCMPATQEQLQAICHGWSVCLQRRSGLRQFPVFLGYPDSTVGQALDRNSGFRSRWWNSDAASRSAQRISCGNGLTSSIGAVCRAGLCLLGEPPRGEAVHERHDSSSADMSPSPTRQANAL